MLPAEMAAAEIGGSWRLLEMFVVLGVWGVIGMTATPIVLTKHDGFRGASLHRRNLAE